jgi:hypothetical protein
MGNFFTNEHRIRENAIKASCVELLKRILILHETPTTENKEHFLSQISQVRIEIIHYLELLDITPSVREHLKDVLRILAVDLDPIKTNDYDFCDDEFKKTSIKAFEDVLKIDRIINGCKDRGDL